mmetsp:Transcript_44193/g.134573  ORF Transcript_44193/g.134573 Transcript_44193/m.134573 type:complete len:111 (+) Transcript_44193:1117-1449(+)
MNVWGREGGGRTETKELGRIAIETCPPRFSSLYSIGGSLRKETNAEDGYMPAEPWTRRKFVNGNIGYASRSSGMCCIEGAMRLVSEKEMMLLLPVRRGDNWRPVFLMISS